MAEQVVQQQPDKYIKCNSCACKYINDDAHIVNDFGYNRLNERFKGCIKCRMRRKVYDDLHHEAKYQRRQTYNNNNRDKINAYNFGKIECKSCGDKVCRNAIRQHERDKGCIKSVTNNTCSDSV